MMLLLALMAAQSTPPAASSIFSPEVRIIEGGVARCAGSTYPQECAHAYVVAQRSEELLSLCIRGIDRKRFEKTRKQSRLADYQALQTNCGDVSDACVMNWRAFFERYFKHRQRPESINEQVQQHCALPRNDF